MFPQSSKMFRLIERISKWFFLFLVDLDLSSFRGWRSGSYAGRCRGKCGRFAVPRTPPPASSVLVCWSKISHMLLFITLAKARRLGLC